MRLWQGAHFSKRNGWRFIIGFDDACHFKPFCTNPRRLEHASPLAQELAAEVEFVVDRFHFDEGHMGAYYATECSPYRPEVKERLEKANMSVAEQRFSWLRRYQHVFRHMNAACFNFMLLVLADLLQETYKLGARG
ncbi:hypothetical protein GPECTOR_382g183 [Gonium pectorale]|uniref:Uncharacterized protein n=1 Tax=Gonium pectorale TaxID=33097 RepID=A0A150FVH2_GONPE|nr:hypothetical protein GPECTOR_382g183 [Gonium pectorale]|eukprot:KXZ41578.1 hypothetical protein GPECTOR_382g183 [Gonium pectorale]